MEENRTNNDVTDKEFKEKFNVGGIMTIQELYNWAKENNCTDYQIIVNCDYDIYKRRTNKASFSNKIDWAREVEI